MKSILIDTSVWIEYFRGSGSIDLDIINDLIDNNQICTNYLIVSELTPPLTLKKELKVIDLLLAIRNIPIVINWEQIIDYQIINLKNGINHVGIPDLIILQNVIHNNLELFSLDKHFLFMNRYENRVAIQRLVQELQARSLRSRSNVSFCYVKPLSS